MDSAASNDNLELLIELHKIGNGECTTIAMDWANDIKVLQWLHDNRKEGCTTWAMYQAAMFNNMKKIKWLHKHNKPWNQWALHCAAEYGYFDIVKWFVKNKRMNDEYVGGAMKYAARNGHIDILKWLYKFWSFSCKKERKYVIDSILEDTQVQKYIRVVKWLERKRNDDDSSMTCFLYLFLL